MKDCTYELTYKEIARSFSSEEELDSYIRNNPDEFSLETAEDYRFSKDLTAENIAIINKVNNKNQEHLKKLRTKISKYDSDEFDDVYDDNSIGVLEFIKTQGLTDKSEQFNLENWERAYRRTLESDYRQLPEEERKAIIEEKVNSEKLRFDQIRKVGKGLHKIAYDVFMNPFLDYSKYPKEVRRKIAEFGSENINIDSLSDEAILQTVKQLYSIKKGLTANKKIKYTFIEPCIDFKDSTYNIRGKMDMVLVYDDNTIDIIDFKVSGTNYDAWDPDKKATALAQLMTYQTMLENIGVKPTNFNLKLIPIQLGRTGDSFTSSNVTSKILTPNISTRYKLFGLLNIKTESQPLTSKLAENTVETVTKMFGFDVFNSGYDEASFQKAYDAMVTKVGNSYQFTMIKGIIKGERKVSKNSREEIEKELKNYLAVLREHRKNQTSKIAQIFNDLKDSENKEISFVSDNSLNRWLNINLTKYKINPNWKAIQNEDLNALGVLMFKNDADRTVDFVSIMYEDIDLPLNLEKGNTILGHLYSDNMSSSNKLVANMGNIELVKLLYLANQLADNYETGELKVLGLSNKSVIDDTVIREKLENNYNILANSVGIETNKVRAGELYARVASLYEAIVNSTSVANYFRANSINPNNFKNDKLSELVNDKAEQLKRLEKLRDALNEHYYKYRFNATEDNSILGYLKSQVDLAISKLSGYSIDFRNETKLSGNILGGQGLRESIENKTLFNSINLRPQDTIPIIQAIYDRVMEANSIIRNKYMAYKVVDRRHTDKFKNSNPGFRNNRFVNNSEIIFKNLIDRSNTRDLRLKDFRYDDTLSKDEKEYLEWYVRDLTRIKYDLTLEEAEDQGYDIFQLPLVRAGALSRIVNNKQNIKEALKDTLGLEDATIDPRMSLGLDSSETDFGKNGLIFDGIFNSFSLSSDPDKRLEMIEKEGLESFDINLERIKDLYNYVVTRKEILDPVIANVSSSLCSYAWNAQLSNGQLELNKPTLDFIVNFIKSSVLDMSLFDKDEKGLWRTVSSIKSVASKMVLGLNVLSMAKEGLVGWWTLFNNANANRFDDSRFGIKEASKAYSMVWQDGFRQIKTITMGEHLNAQYGIANVSEQEMVERLNYYQGEVGRVNNILFFTARSPDFLHRMTVFTAYMLKDGNYDAHKLVGDHIEYNWREDKRFSIYAKYQNTPESEIPKSELETFQEQRSLYLTIWRQMIDEGAVVTNWETGETRSMTDDDKDIPKAYTVLESNKMIQEANMMFGYMDSTNKSMWFRKGIGVILGQFQSYITARGAQYFLTPGTYKTGKWVDKVDPVTGKKLYWKYDDSGKRVETTENTGFPVKDWQGGMMEGIFWSLASLINVVNYIKGGTSREDFLKAWNDPTKLRNLNLFLGDVGGLAFFSILMYLLFGNVKESDKTAIDKNIELVLRNASSEFNIWKTFTGQLELNFVAWGVITRFVTSLKDAISGDSNLPRAFVSNVGAFKPFKPMIYDMFPLDEQE